MTTPTDAMTVHRSFADERRTAAERALELIREAPLTSQGELEKFNAALGWVKARAKELESREQEITRPLRAALDSARDLFRPARSALAALEQTCKTRMGEYLQAQQALAAAAIDRARELAAAGQTGEARDALAQIPERAAAEGLSTRDHWTFEVINIDIVPRDFVLPDSAAIRREMQAQLAAGQTPTIPGIKFTRGVTIARRV